MPQAFPHTYKVNLSWNDGSMGTATCNNNPPMVVGPPPQFDGPDNIWSPEDLLLSAIQTCLMTTFFSLAKRRELEVSHYQSEIAGDLDKTSEGLLFTGINMHVTVQTNDNNKAERLLHLAERYCIISNAMNVKPKLTVSFPEA